MFDFWCAFNTCNIHNVTLQLTSVYVLWDSASQLSGIDRRFTLSVMAVVFWVRWNERNKVIFSNHSVLSFNAFILKVVNFFHIWTGINSSLDQMCRDDSILTITED
jgi:hypothetical protein